jgi:type IV pilus assembly protein PilQ
MEYKMEAPMGDINNKYPRGGLLAVLLAAVLIFGCSGKKAVEKDPFLEKWSTMAETQTGSSPTPRDRDVLTALEIPADPGEALVGASAKSLPTQRVSLKMRQADVKTVLRSLARIVDKNILVKNEIKGEITVDFHDVPWDQAFNSLLNTQGLTYIWEGNIIRVMTFDDKDLDLKRKTQDMGIKWVAPLHTVVVPIDYAKPKDLKETLESFLTPSKEGKPRGSVRVDEFSNSLVISAIRDDLVRMMTVIKKIDKPTPQIQIKANIVETTKETARNLGIQWGGMYQGTIARDQSAWITPGGSINTGSTTSPAALIPNPMGGGYSPIFGQSGISGQGFGVNFPAANAAMVAAGGAGSLGLMIGTLGGNILEMQLNALQKDSKLNILSSPSITTLDNQMAFTENGEKVPVNTQTISGGTISNTVVYIDAVLRLEIKPHVIDDQTLSMKIIVKKDEVDPVRQVFGNPYIIKKQTETNLIVRNGETIVISGLTKQSNQGGDSGIPGLKDIPVLGWLFKSDTKDNKMEEVLIFITPRILQPYQVSVAAPNAQTAPVTKPANSNRTAGAASGEAPQKEKAPQQ